MTAVLVASHGGSGRGTFPNTGSERSGSADEAGARRITRARPREREGRRRAANGRDLCHFLERWNNASADERAGAATVALTRRAHARVRLRSDPRHEHRRQRAAAGGNGERRTPTVVAER